MYTHLQPLIEFYKLSTSFSNIIAKILPLKYFRGSKYIKHTEIQYKQASRRLEHESNANKDENVCSCISLHLNAKHETYKMELHKK